MHSPEYYSDLIENAISSIIYPSSPDGLYAPIKYTLEGGGKRIRPMLLLATADAFGYNPEKAINQAAGLEMFHNFTLLHDDVMDNAFVRRGRPTVHRRWNMCTAILSGDAMLTLATQLMTKCSPDILPEILELFNATAMEIYEGQQYDMDFENSTGISVDEYMEMIRLKTSVLLACGCKMGAILADASVKSQEAMYRYGELLGLAFQLQDDYLDTYGDPALFGKEIGGDIINEKKTWLWITAMTECPEQMTAVIDEKLTDYLKVKNIKEVYDSLNLGDRTHKLIERYAEMAVEALADAELSEEGLLFFKNLAGKLSSRSN
ncbi:MAG: polyprenyl synthetase family protein [Bacteroidales bacterium]|nr:polyprenyl synthetase family protein [Bacteroidales bacterium]